MNSVADQLYDMDTGLFPDEEVLLDVNGNPINMQDQVVFQDSVMPYEQTGTVVETSPREGLVQVRDGREIRNLNIGTCYIRVTKCALVSLLYHTLNFLRRNQEELESLKQQKGDRNDQEKEEE